MFEHHKEPVLSKGGFVRRITKAIFCGFLILTGTLIFGMVGYHYIENVPWVDAYLECSMLFAGMGSTLVLHTTAGKIFAGTYALMCAFALLFPITLVLLPILHRFLHKFHLKQ